MLRKLWRYAVRVWCIRKPILGKVRGSGVLCWSKEWTLRGIPWLSYIFLFYSPPDFFSHLFMLLLKMLFCLCGVGCKMLTPPDVGPSRYSLFILQLFEIPWLMTAHSLFLLNYVNLENNLLHHWWFGWVILKGLYTYVVCCFVPFFVFFLSFLFFSPSMLFFFY